jgi:hypothetical protein
MMLIRVCGSTEVEVKERKDRVDERRARRSKKGSFRAAVSLWRALR